MINPEILGFMPANEELEGAPIDFEKLARTVSKGFRITNRNTRASRGIIHVVTRREDDLFEVRLESRKAEPISAAPEPYFRHIVNVTRQRAVWGHPNAAVLERWLYLFGSQDPTESSHFPNVKFGGGLNETEFLKRFGESEPDQEATKQLRVYTERIYNENGMGHWMFNWVSDERAPQDNPPNQPNQA